jgi:hypothetical protein
MVDWFHDNFEDPAQHTPYESAEGGYQYIWGGPYDAMDQISNTFLDATEEEVEAAIDAIQSDGTFDWAPIDSRIRPDEFDDEEGEEQPPSLADRVNALSGELDELEEALRQLRNQAPMMGHNQPPAEMRIGLDQRNLDKAQDSINEIRAELARPDPVNNADPIPIKKAESRFRALAGKVLGWMKAAGKALVLGGLGKIGAELWDDPSAFLQKLEAVANTLEAWARHLQMPF